MTPNKQAQFALTQYREGRKEYARHCWKSAMSGLIKQQKVKR